MAINLASKYSDQIAEVFTRASFIKGKTAETYDLTGVKTLKVYTPITVEEVDYDRDGGLKRYGDVTEMQDVVQELTMTQGQITVRMYALVGITDDVGQVLMRIHILNTFGIIRVGVVCDRLRGLFLVRDAVCLLLDNLLAVFCVKIFCRHRG